MAEIDVRQLPQLWNTACACMKNKDYANAAKLMKVLSCEGYSEAQYYLGNMYLNGLAVEKNLAEAYRLLNSAAHNGHAAAQCRLAGMYASGTHVAKDVLAAAWWLLRSAVRGNAEAQFNLGRMFAAGIGVDKNAAEAIWWLHAAAEQGNANAKALLEKSNNPKARPGTMQDAAVHTLRELAEKGHPYAMYCLGKVCDGGYAISLDYKNEVEAQRWYQKALPLMKKLAEQGDSVAQVTLSRIYGAVKADQEEVWYWVERAAASGDAQAQSRLGRANYNGRNGDWEEAMRWLELAARQGDTEAQFTLGLTYSDYEAIRRSEFWLTRAAEQGHSAAQHSLWYNAFTTEKEEYWKKKWE